MHDEPNLSRDASRPAWVVRLAAARPDIVWVAPFMGYLLLLGLQDLLPREYMPVAIALRGVGGLWLFWIFRHYFMPLGKAHWPIALFAGVLVAAGWVAGQHWLNGIHLGEKSLGGRLFLFPGIPDDEYPFADISALSRYSQIVLRITVAVITVPIVEEIFWRGFMLRALISWDRFEHVPLGRFTWFSFLGTALLSMFQHPDNWGVSIFCWFAYNGLFYWTKSLRCLMITHGVTNLALYLYVLAAEDWLFW